MNRKFKIYLFILFIISLLSLLFNLINASLLNKCSNISFFLSNKKKELFQIEIFSQTRNYSKLLTVISLDSRSNRSSCSGNLRLIILVWICA